MPVEIKDCDGGIGTIIETRGRVTDQELIDAFNDHLKDDEERFKQYKYILIDHFALAKVDITDETVEKISGLFAEPSRVNPDSIVAMVTYVSYGANIDLVDRISKLHEVFSNRSCWETLLFRTRPQAVRWIKSKVKERFGIDHLTFD